MDRTKLVPLKEAGSLFPRPPSYQTILRKIQVGTKGVKLQAKYDGYRYWTCQQWVDDFHREISEHRRLRCEHLMAPITSSEERCRRAYEEILAL